MGTASEMAQHWQWLGNGNRHGIGTGYLLVVFSKSMNEFVH